jgi:hypothetical protein
VSVLLIAVDLSYLIKKKIINPLTYSLFAIGVVYLLTLLYIKISRFKTSYIIVPYERLFILLLVILVGVHIFGLILIRQNINKNDRYETGVNIIILSLSVFFILTWGILILPISSSIWENTSHDDYLYLLGSKKTRK